MTIKLTDIRNKVTELKEKTKKKQYTSRWNSRGASGNMR